MKEFPVQVDPPQNRPSNPPFQTSCYCLKSTTAAVLIAALYSLFSLLSGTVCIAMLTVKSFREEVISTLYERAKEYYNEYYKDGISDYYSEMSRDEYETALMFWIKVYIGIAALVFFFCIMTFHGVLTGQACHLIPLYVWIFLKLILTIVYLCYYMASVANSDSGMTNIVMIILLVGVKVYFLSCIWNAFRQLKFQAYQQNGYSLVYQPGLPNYNQAVMGKDLPPPAYSP